MIIAQCKRYTEQNFSTNCWFVSIANSAKHDEFHAILASLVGSCYKKKNCFNLSENTNIYVKQTTWCRSLRNRNLKRLPVEKMINDTLLFMFTNEPNCRKANIVFLEITIVIWIVIRSKFCMMNWLTYSIFLILVVWGPTARQIYFK